MEENNEEKTKKKIAKYTAMQFFIIKGVNKNYKQFIKNKYKESDFRTEKKWEIEFRGQKVID